MTASQHHSQRHMGAHLAAAPGAGFDQRFVDCDMPQTSLDRGRVPPIGVYAVGSHGHWGGLPSNAPEMSERLALI